MTRFLRPLRQAFRDLLNVQIPVPDPLMLWDFAVDRWQQRKATK